MTTQTSTNPLTRPAAMDMLMVEDQIDYRPTLTHTNSTRNSTIGGGDQTKAARTLNFTLNGGDNMNVLSANSTIHNRFSDLSDVTISDDDDEEEMEKNVGTIMANAKILASPPPKGVRTNNGSIAKGK